MMHQEPPVHKSHVHGVNGHVAVHSVNQRLCAIALSLLCFAFFATPVYAQPETHTENVLSQINAANQLVRDGEIQAALDAYSSVENDPAVQSQLNYNFGVALYRNGDIAAAQKLFTEAAGNSDNHLAANASYNLGNCLYSRSLQQMQQPESGTDPAQIIDQLRKAISHYRSSLRSGDSGADARANIELAAELIRQLEQKQEQQKQDQEQQDPEKQDEQQQQDQNQENENQQQQDQSQSEDSSEQQQNQQGEQQQSEENQSEENQSEQNQGEQKQGEQKQGESKQPDSSDPSDSTDPENGEQSDQANQQPANPEGELKAANEQKQQNEKPSEVASGQDDRSRPMTREEAMKMLQAIRDRDMLRRFQQQQRDRSRQVPVEKDW